MRLLFVGGVAAAAVGGNPSPTLAQNVAPRSGEIVAREGQETVDRLAAGQASASALLPAITGETTWLITAATLIVGVLIGSVWERHRNRRDRSLRF
jgi:hypothetical protein